MHTAENLTNAYRCLENQIFRSGDYALVPVRFEDRYDIMKWRNEQIYHLRQPEPLTRERQDIYFEQVVTPLFSCEKPSQLIFSYLENDRCIGYGGLVHIDWISRNAEISFVMDTELERDHFVRHWALYLNLIQEVAFTGISLHKIFTYAYDLRPRLYTALEQCGFQKEAVLRQHVLVDDRYFDVVIHAKFNGNFSQTL